MRGAVAEAENGKVGSGRERGRGRDVERMKWVWGVVKEGVKGRSVEMSG